MLICPKTVWQMINRDNLCETLMSRVAGTKVLKPFLQTFGKMELKIFTVKTIFP